MPELMQFDYDTIKAGLFKELRGKTEGKYYWGDGEGWVEFTREPDGYYLARLSTHGMQLHFRYKHQDIETTRPATNEAPFTFFPQGKPFNPMEHEQCK
ncbi:MAG: hypothetical protein ACXVIY_03125 [Mucilaginibacter sp.]